jgi:hypothetical protein
MKLFRYFLMLFVIMTAVSCTNNADNALPTQVPTAAPLTGPPGTNKLNAPWENTINPTIGLAIEHPQDWAGNSTDEAIRLAPISRPNTLSSNTMIANVSLFNAVDVDNAQSVVSTLEMMISPESMGGTTTISILSEPMEIAIDGFETAVTQLTITPDSFVPPPEDLGEIADTFQDPEPTFLYFAVLRQNNRNVVFTGSVSATFQEEYLPIFDAMLKTIELKELGNVE